MSPCPSPEVLFRFGSGLPGDATDPALDAHINACDACQAALDRAADKESVGSGHSAGRVPAPEDLPRIPGFEIIRELGRGGMGVVFLAREINTGRTVALKFLPSGPFAAPRDRARWVKEARTAARVRHSHIVQVYRVDEAGGWLYLVLEYIPGGSLKEHLKSPLAPRVAAMLLLQIAEALAELHRAGVWHLDLKPANILVDAAPKTSLDRAPLKLTDFGIARSCDDSDGTRSSAGAALGTPSYMAPEQVAGQRSALGPATDVHAIGSILYEVLTGRPPFLGDSVAETMRQIQVQDPVPLRRLNPKVPRDLETLCLKCLEKDSSRRYSSAEALAGDLRQFLDGRPITARRVSALERTWRWCRRRPAIASLVTALGVTTAGGFVGLYTLWRISESERARAVSESARAEAARRISEDKETVASRALSELSLVLYFAVANPESLTERRIHDLTSSVREQTRSLRNHRRAGALGDPGLGILERVLAEKFMACGRHEDARSMLADSVAYLKECHELHPNDEGILWQLCQSLLHCGHLATEQRSYEEAGDLYDQTASLLASLQTVSHRLELATDLYWVRRNLTDRLTGYGESVRSRELADANIRMLATLGQSVEHQFRPLPAVETSAGHVTPDEAAIERALSIAHNFPGDPDLQRVVEWHIVNWTSSRVVRPLANAKPSIGTTSETDSDGWAESLVSATRSRCAALGLDEASLIKVSFKVIDPVASAAACLRGAGQLDVAETTVARFMAFARRILREYPGRPESHMILSEAYFQDSKNAWKRDDRLRVERSLRQALDSAKSREQGPSRWERPPVR